MNKQLIVLDYVEGKAIIRSLHEDTDIKEYIKHTLGLPLYPCEYMFSEKLIIDIAESD